jgi:hypothetical protein
MFMELFEFQIRPKLFSKKKNLSQWPMAYAKYTNPTPPMSLFGWLIQ